ncbi:hypothetical protein TH25_11465 [Thalassospira profundimaris]|uniref:Uncharacterized protein n=1 Tax=Thalassospira profundimaris TaxID=502049 RepID=A0A367X9U5_9PROT|nr:hypothetical protein [Thalassospira profundimaris]RCK50229.1 hypothetical protein TH25_11465 [Thalassospira profundimaris]
MLTLKDCFDFSDLTEDEICAIAECEHIPIISALEEGESLIHSRHGRQQIAAMLLKRARECELSGMEVHASHLRCIHKAFITRFAP